MGCRNERYKWFPGTWEVNSKGLVIFWRENEAEGGIGPVPRLLGFGTRLMVWHLLDIEHLKILDWERKISAHFKYFEFEGILLYLSGNG